MCVTTRKENENDRLKLYYEVKLTLLRCKTYFLYNPPKTEDEKYAYDIIQKAYWINEKKIEMLDYSTMKRLKNAIGLWRMKSGNLFVLTLPKRIEKENASFFDALY